MISKTRFFSYGKPIVEYFVACTWIQGDLWDWRFSQQHQWRFKSSNMWRHIDWQLSTFCTSCFYLQE